jgi:glucan phosphorylase
MFLRRADERIRETGVFFHKEMIFITGHTVLCASNTKWTYDLFTHIIKQWLGIGPKQMVVQNGLQEYSDTTQVYGTTWRKEKESETLCNVVGL